jgi:diguanylate cyclase (GGDEF)-like protein
MKIKKAFSLSTKIVCLMALVFSVVFLTIFLVFDKINKEALYTAEEEKAETIVGMLAPILAIELYLGRDTNIVTLAKQVTSNPNILSFKIVQNTQELVNIENNNSEIIDNEEDFNTQTELMHPITNEAMAVLYLSYSSAHYYTLTRQYRMVLLATFAVLSLLIVFFTFYIRHLLTPLKKIASEVSALTPGEELLLPSYDKNTEIGNIAVALKEMNIRISNYAKQQKDIAGYLEKEVENKTVQLRGQLYTDTLTGCPNRIRLLEDLANADDGILLIINVDGFQQINDFYGHIAGDHVLTSLSVTLKQITSTQPEMTVYKLSGDEFAVFTSHSIGYHSLELFLKGLGDRIEDIPIYYEKAKIKIQVTMGTTVDIQDGMEKADIALKTARINHKPYMIYDGSLNIEHEYHQNMQWVQRLTAAIEQDRIVPYFQPILDNSTGAVVSYECLVRLIEEDGAVLSPFHFLEISKKARLYTRLTRTMVEKSCRHFSGKTDHFSINLSVDDILDEDTVAFIKEQIRLYDVQEQIIFEILESVGIENYSEVLSFIEEMKLLGCSFAIDDFGSGYSNFDHLLQLKIDYIKIDGSLIRNLHTDTNAISIIEAIVHFAHKRQLICIAEFVHNAQVHDIVKELGIDRSQGFYLGEPRSDTMSV